MRVDIAGDAPASRVSPQKGDEDIILLIQQGNLTRAFDLLMGRYQNKVYRLCVVYAPTPADAGDNAQEALLRVWRALPSYDGRAALSTWIYAITRNWCLTQLGKRRATVSIDEEPMRRLVEEQPATDGLEDQARRETIRRLVEELPPTTQRAVKLFYFEEQSVLQVAELLGIPEGTIKTHLFTARRRLLTRLIELGLGEPEHWTI